MIKKYWSACKAPVTLVEKYSNFMKICPMGSELLHTDSWTDMTKLIIALCNFANAPTRRPKQEHMD